MAEFAQLGSVQALATALLHFIWQGSLIALAAAALMRVARTAAVRYAIGIGALVAMLAAPALTFAVLIDSTPSVARTATGHAPPAAVREAVVTETTLASPAGFTDAGLWSAAGVFAWIVGMTILSVRLAGGWYIARRMTTHAVRPAAAHVQAAAALLAEKLALRRAVRVLESSAVAVPVLVGWLKPAVVLPVAALAGLSPAQIEALLAHELAHVHRHDYLVNLLQSLAEVVLFYHPAVWWLSRRVRTERELCCDDLAVGLCDRLVYATALTDLAAMRAPRVALAATGGDLLTRVKRILGREEPSMSSNARWIPAVAVAAVALAAVPALLASVRTASAIGAESPTPALAVAAVVEDATIANPSAEPERASDQSGREEAELRVQAELRAKLEELRAQLLARADALEGLGPALADLRAIAVAD
jgi:beta-lactamase regulating signal transducer with metallopeptidase domain